MTTPEITSPTKTEYICTKCGAIDFDAGNNPPAPLALHCYKCKAGRGLSADQIRMNLNGMVTAADLRLAVDAGLMQGEAHAN